MVDKRITIKDVALASGVGLGTASRVINNGDRVSAATRERVAMAIAQLGYEPHQLAQSMRRGSTRTVGIMVRDITVPAFAGFVRQAQEVLQAAGYVLLITCSENDKKRELGILQLLRRQRVDGLIMNTAMERDPELAAARNGIGVPIVMVDRENCEPADSILIGHYDGMREALRYLFSLGHRRIGLITGSPGVYAGRERLQAYRDAHTAHGVPLDPDLLRASGFSGDVAFEEAHRLLDLPAPPTAIIAGGIALLEGLLRAVQARRLSVPDQLSLVANADSELARLASPQVTVVQVDYAKLGEVGARFLLGRLDGQVPEGPRRFVQQTELIIRGSCAPPGKTS